MSTGTVQIRRVRVADVRMDARFQPRNATGALVNEAEVVRMREGGRTRGHASGWAPDLYDPIRIWESPEGDLFVVEGFHRLALAQGAGVEEFDANVHSGISLEEAQALARRSNLKTRPMDPIEEADVYRAERDKGRNWEEVAREFDRRAPGYYERRAALSYLLPSLKDDVRRRVLPVDYAETIGETARDGATPGLQLFLAGLAIRTKVRIDLFRRLAAALLSRAKGFVPKGDESGFLFSFEETSDTGAQAASEALVEATRAAGVRDGWDALHSAGRKQVRRLEAAGLPVPEELARLVAGVDTFRAEADRAVGRILGETTTSGHTAPGVAAVREARPFLKWVGSKQREAPTLVPMIRARLGEGGAYYEPFLGSGAVYFALAPSRAVLGDALPDLVDCYRSVRDRPSDVAQALARLIERGWDRGPFEEIRAWEPTEEIDRAARVIYLNKTGFNGLWRTNAAGKFNVSCAGYKSPRFPSISDLLRASDILQAAELHVGDYADTIETVQAGDVAFVDPPYPETFQGYAGAATEVDPRELAMILRAAWERGVGIVATLPESEDIRPLFVEWCDPIALSRQTGVACKSSARGTLNQIAWVSKLARE